MLYLWLLVIWGLFKAQMGYLSLSKVHVMCSSFLNSSALLWVVLALCVMVVKRLY